MSLNKSMLFTLDQSPVPIDGTDPSVYDISQKVLVFPFTVSANVTQLAVSQVGEGQDWIILSWVSSQPGQNPVQPSAYAMKYYSTEWHNTRIPSGFYFYDFTNPPAMIYPDMIPLLPGNYFLNVQNLANQWAQCTVSILTV